MHIIIPNLIASAEKALGLICPQRQKQTGDIHFSKDLLERMVHMANFAYKNTQSSLEQTELIFIEYLQDAGYRLTFFHDTHEFSGIVARKGKELMVSYKGTSSKQNIITDLQFFKRPVRFARGNVHQGFYRSFLDSKHVIDGIFNEQVSQMLLSFNSDKSLLDKSKLIIDVKARANTLDREFYRQLKQDLKSQPELTKSDILATLSDYANMDDEALIELISKMSKHPEMENYANDPQMIILRELVQYAGIKQAKITFDGHSLGAAQATISALYYTKKYSLDPKNLQVFTFGSPRVFDFKMAAEYEELLGDVTYRVTEHDQDLVPSLLPGILNFKHVGKNIRLKKSPEFWMHLLKGYDNAVSKLDPQKMMEFNNHASLLSSPFNPFFYFKILVLLPQLFFSYLQETAYHQIKGSDSDRITE